eukprot:EG_transcript_6918
MRCGAWAFGRLVGPRWALRAYSSETPPPARPAVPIVAQPLRIDPAPRVVRKEREGEHVQLRFSDGRLGRFHAWWLRGNTPASLHPSGQRLSSIAEVDTRRNITKVELAERGQFLKVTWDDDVQASFSADYLHRHNCHPISAVAKWRASSRPQPLQAVEAVPRLRYADYMADPQALLAALAALNKAGLFVLTGAPSHATHPEPGWDRALPAIATRIAPLSHTYLYGDVFEVASQPAARNLAYTGQALLQHQDLIYYESAPGVQMLHCVQFDDAVEGGAISFLDVMGAAETLRRQDRAAFHTLCTVPATFIKSRPGSTSTEAIGQRNECGHAAHLAVQRPHIRLDPYGEILDVNWAPPFEGPCRVPVAQYARYHAAYCKFHALIEGPRPGEAEEPSRYAATHTVRFRMRPGEVVVFNNRRMLHARDAFGGAGRRMKRGCYLNADEVVSRYVTLRRALAEAAAAAGEVRDDASLEAAATQRFLTAGLDTVEKRLGADLRMGAGTLPFAGSHRHEGPQG